MPKIKSDIIFLGAGLNADDELRLIPVGDSVYRLNALVGEDASNGVLTNMKGCEQVALPPSITFTSSEVYSVVGSFYNAAQRACFYFIHSLPYDSGGGVYLYDDKVLRYNTDTETVDLIFLDTGGYLGLTETSYMNDCRMIDNWLFFNPKGAEPKMIDVVMAYNYANYSAYNIALTYAFGDVVTFKGGLFSALVAISAAETPSTDVAKWERIGDAYSNDTFFGQDAFGFCFDVLKQPPLKRLGFNYGTEPYYAAGYGANSVKGKVFKFSYRYQYHDNTYSVFSAISRPSFPPNGELYNGELIGDSTTNNHIVFQIPLGIPSIVKRVELAFQDGEGDWKMAVSVDRQLQSLLVSDALEYKFYNNESYASVDNGLLDEIYSLVPREAGAQEMINLNTLVYGRCKEGFDSLRADDIDVALTTTPIELVESLDIDVLVRDAGTLLGETATGDWIAERNDPGNSKPLNYIARLSLAWAPVGLTAGDIFSIVLDGVSYRYPIIADDIIDQDNLASALAYFLFSQDAIRTEVVEIMGSWYIKLISEEYYPQISEAIFYTPLTSSAVFAKQSGFKTGAKHPFCIFYYDKNLRRGDANVSDDLSIYIPMFTEETDTITGTNWKYTIPWEVDHLPPDWARYWRFGYARNKLTDYFVQYIIEDYGDEGSFSYFDITPLQTLKVTEEAGWNQFPNSIIDEYVWEKGDRVRLLTETPGIGVEGLGDLIERIWDYEILKYDDDTKRIYIQLVNAADKPDVGENSLIEIYSPLPADSVDLFYEYGDLMPIIPDSVGVFVHGGIDQDQDTGTDVPAKGIFTQGDVFHIMRTPSKPLAGGGLETIGAFHESMNYSDFYISDYWDKGKIGVESNIGEQTLNILRYSNQYIQGTQINGLSTFEGTKYREVNDIFGEIRAIREVGDTLKVYQDVKSSSVLIGRQEYTDSQGKTQVNTSDRVLGSIRYSESNYGTIFKESVTKNNRYVYGFDVYNGVVWRDSANGLFPISGRFATPEGSGSYKMQSYFKEKAKALIASGVENVNVFILWDEEFGLLYVTFKDKVNADNTETIIFHEGSNRWITFADLTREDTWNEFLFPIYTVVKGFSAGLDQTFNKEDGFMYFVLKTGAAQIIEADLNALLFTLYAPTITSSPSIDPGLLNLALTLYEPTITIVDAVTISVAPTTLDFNANGTPQKGAAVFEVTASGAWTSGIIDFEGVVNYLDPDSGGAGVTDVTVTVNPNFSPSSFTDTIRFSTVNNQVDVTVTIDAA